MYEESEVDYYLAKLEKLQTIKKELKFTERKSKKRFKISDFKVVKKLGGGRTGKVYKAIHRTSGVVVAIKVISISSIVKENTEKYVKQEIEIHSKLNHPNIVRFFAYFYDKKRIYIVEEFCENGELLQELLKERNFSESKTSKYIYQITSALKHMHEKGIIHRDLKPENVLINKNGTLKLADFGFSQYKKMYRSKQTVLGTPDYIAPEMLELSRRSGRNGEGRCSYNERIDCWAIGILVFELLVGTCPFYSDYVGETMELIQSYDFELPDRLSLLAKDFIRKILTHPRKRLTCNAILKHRFITKYNKISK